MGTGCSSDKSGDRCVGKTNVLLRYSKKQFDYSYRCTSKVIIDQVVEKINVPQNLIVSLTIWDLPGSEDMDLRSTYYRNVDAAIVIVDLSDMNSIELAGTWKLDFINKATKTREIKETLPSGLQTSKLENINDYDPRTVPVMLLGNKYDLVEEQIEREEMKEVLEPDINKENLDTSEEGQNDVEEIPLVEMTIEKEKDNENIFSKFDNHTKKSSPLPSQEIPECVKFLEEMEQKHDFIGSVVVSAKDDDGSVDAAMKSLVRYLLDKTKFIRPRKFKDNKEMIQNKKRRVQINDFKDLATVQIQEFDTLFERCNVPVKRSSDYQVYYELCLKKVKQSCADQGYITESGSSLEDCIVGLKDAVNDAFARELQVEDDENFVRLTFELNTEDEEDKIKIKQNRLLLGVLDIFHLEYAAVSNAIMRDGPNMTIVLQKLGDKLDANMENLEEMVKEHLMKDVPQGRKLDEKVYREHVEKTRAICERNRARIGHAQELIQDLMNQIENAIKKIKASLIW